MSRCQVPAGEVSVVRSTPGGFRPGKRYSFGQNGVSSRLHARVPGSQRRRYPRRTFFVCLNGAECGLPITSGFCAIDASWLDTSSRGRVLGTLAATLERCAMQLGIVPATAFAGLAEVFTRSQARCTRAPSRYKQPHACVPWPRIRRCPWWQVRDPTLGDFCHQVLIQGRR
jgi:hypothetical protein